MRWLKFTASGKTSWGIVEGDKVVTVSVAGKDAASQVDQEQSWRIRLTDERP